VVLLAALGQLGCGVQRPLAGDLVAGQCLPDRQLVQGDRRPRLVRRRPCCKVLWASPIVRGASREAAAWSDLRIST
jgi:hypothetical protein